MTALRGIIQDMAKFRDMRKMVAMLDALNDERTSADKVNIEADGEYYPSLADKETVINHYVKLGYSDKPKARKIYRDLTSSRYGYIQEKKRYAGRRVDVTGAGGDLIKEFILYPYGAQIHWGMWWEIIKAYKIVAGAVIAILSAIVGAVIGARIN